MGAKMADEVSKRSNLSLWARISSFAKKVFWSQQQFYEKRLWQSRMGNNKPWPIAIYLDNRTSSLLLRLCKNVLVYPLTQPPTHSLAKPCMEAGPFWGFITKIPSVHFFHAAGALVRFWSCGEKEKRIISWGNQLSTMYSTVCDVSIVQTVLSMNSWYFFTVV